MQHLYHLCKYIKGGPRHLNKDSYCFQLLWAEDTISKDLSKGPIMMLLKQDNLQVCDKWHGITLLSLPSQVFCQIFMGRISLAIDSKFTRTSWIQKRMRMCSRPDICSQNHQCLEWYSPLYINFINFQIAFNSLHSETLWKIFRSYGLSSKM